MARKIQLSDYGVMRCTRLASVDPDRTCDAMMKCVPTVEGAEVVERYTCPECGAVFENKFPLTGTDVTPAVEVVYDEGKVSGGFFRCGTVKLPVREAVPELQAGAYIPNLKFFVYRPEAETLAEAINDGSPVMLQGEAGCGKTQLVEWLAMQTNTPFIRLACDESMTADDAKGNYELKDGNTVASLGVVATAMKEGYWLLVDENNAMTDAQRIFWHSVLDERMLCIPALKETVHAHADFRIFFAQNPASSGIYGGTHEDNAAFCDRFDYWVNLDYLPADKEKQVVLNHAPKVKVDVLEKMLKAASEVRNAASATPRRYDGTFSTRAVMRWAYFAQKWPLKKATKFALLQRLAKSDADALLNIIKLHVPEATR